MQDYAEAVAAARDMPPTRRCLLCGEQRPVFATVLGEIIACPCVEKWPGNPMMIGVDVSKMPYVIVKVTR